MQAANKKLALSLSMIALGMVMLSFAAVPLYRIFCQVTGFGGTPMVAETARENVLPRELTVSFVANTDRAMPWRFVPNQPKVKVHIGESKLISYRAENLTQRDITGMATFNVTPHAAGKYFTKVQCFCFENQTLKAGERVNMPVSFFIDPALASDRALRGLTNITLSYTFFNVETSGKL